MKKLNIFMLLFLFSNVLFSMEQEIRQTTQITTQKLSKSQKRNFRRKRARQARQGNQPVLKACTICKDADRLFKAVCAGLEEDGEKIEKSVVKQFITPLFFGADFEQENSRHVFIRGAQDSSDDTEKKYGPDTFGCESWEIPDSVFAYWRMRKDKEMKEALSDTIE